MKSIHIRDIPTETFEALRRLANSHRRSLQEELLTILERAARIAPPLEPRHITWITVNTGVSDSTWSRGEINDVDDR